MPTAVDPRMAVGYTAASGRHRDVKQKLKIRIRSVKEVRAVKRNTDHVRRRRREGRAVVRKKLTRNGLALNAQRQE